MIQQTLRVLLADDMPANLRAMTRLLSRHECEVITAGNGQQAVKLFREATFDFIILDLQMPKLDGLGACRAIRESFNGKDIPIIAMSARCTELDQQACRDAGMTACLPKPVDVDELVETIKSFKKGDALEITMQPPTADVGGNDVILDRKEAMNRLQGDESLYDLLIKQFNEQSDPLLETIQSAVDNGEWEEVSKAAHRLRGIAANLGAKALQNACATLETGSPNGVRPDYLAMTKEVRSMAQEVTRELGLSDRR